MTDPIAREEREIANRRHAFDSIALIGVDATIKSMAAMLSFLEVREAKKDARIRELEEALRPFALAADAADRKAAESARLGMGSMSDNASAGLGITFGHCRRARAALSQEKK